MFESMSKITEKIFLGNFVGAEDISSLKKNNITRVLSLVGYLSPTYRQQDNIEQLKYDLADDPNQNVYPILKKCLNFIDEAKENVFVHCAAGVSRSATIVIAYLMWKDKKTYKEALDFVLKRRFVGPNFGFVKQLEKFEKDLKENNYDLDQINFNLSYSYQTGLK